MDYTESQAWSRAFFEHPDNVDGVLYRARHDQDQRSIGLFERPAAAASTAPHGLLAVLETHGFNEDLDFTLDLLERCDHLPVPDALD